MTYIPTKPAVSTSVPMPEKPQDPMIKFRAVIRGQNKKGGDRTQLYLTSEACKEFSDLLAVMAVNEKGTKLDLHVTKRMTNDGTREFDSAICFVKPVQDAPGRGGYKPPTNMEAVKSDFKK